MNNLPLGYKMENGKIVAENGEMKIVQLINDLYALGVRSEVVRDVLNEFKVPKSGGVDEFDSARSKIIDRAIELEKQWREEGSR